MKRCNVAIKHWTLPDFDPVEKSLTINGPLPLEIDFDDVDHKEVQAYAEAVVVVLNSHLDQIERNLPKRFR